MTSLIPATARRARLDLTAKLFRGFADPSRLAILEALRDGEQSVTEIVAATGLTQSNVSGHLRCLRDCGLVTSRSEGRFVLYGLANREVLAVLASADTLLAVYAASISACINYGSDGRTPDREPG